MLKRALHHVCFLFVTLILVSCGFEPCQRQCDANGEHCRRDCGSGQFECVEADDWGYPKVSVPAGTDGMPPFFVSGSYPMQSARAIDSNQIIIDSGQVPLVMTVGRRTQWTSWFGGAEINPLGANGLPDADRAWDGMRIVPNRECEYKVTNNTAVYPAPATSVFGDDLSPSVLWSTISNTDPQLFYLGLDNKYHWLGSSSRNAESDADTIVLYNELQMVANRITPCYFRYGMGLYVGLAPDIGQGQAKESDVVLTYHIPDAKVPGTPMDPNVAPSISAGMSAAQADMSQNEPKLINMQYRGMDGYLVRGIPSYELPNAESEDKLFFKILDQYYDDNSGGYVVKLKEGTRSAKPGPLETIVGVITDPVRIIMQRLYQGIVANPTFLGAVRAVLVLYIIFYGYQFMIGAGNWAEDRKTFMMKMIRIALIIGVMSPTSWDFFYNHLFKAFTDGVIEIAGLLMSPFADFDPDSPWYSMDRLMAKFFSGETAAKITSTIFSNFPLGILYVIVLYFAMALFMISLIKALGIYLISFIVMAILIVMFPIFFVFMLFERTRKLFDEWWNQMVAYGVQQLLLFASLGMFATLVVNYMERTIGYQVCWNIFADFDIFGVNANLSPDLHLFDFRFWMPDISNEMGNIWIDANGDGRREFLPTPETAYRYIDMPYFDPIFDRDKIARYKTEKDFLDVIDLVLFLLVIFLMKAFMEFVKKISTTLKGGGGVNDTGNIFPADPSREFGSAVFRMGKLGLTTGAGIVREGVSLGRSAANSYTGKVVRSKLSNKMDDLKGRIMGRKPANAAPAGGAGRKGIPDPRNPKQGGTGKDIEGILRGGTDRPNPEVVNQSGVLDAAEKLSVDGNKLGGKDLLGLDKGQGANLINMANTLTNDMINKSRQGDSGILSEIADPSGAGGRSSAQGVGTTVRSGINMQPTKDARGSSGNDRLDKLNNVLDRFDRSRTDFMRGADLHELEEIVRDNADLRQFLGAREAVLLDDMTRRYEKMVREAEDKHGTTQLGHDDKKEGKGYLETFTDAVGGISTGSIYTESDAAEQQRAAAAAQRHADIAQQREEQTQGERNRRFKEADEQSRLQQAAQETAAREAAERDAKAKKKKLEEEEAARLAQQRQQADDTEKARKLSDSQKKDDSNNDGTTKR